jgi:ring-1,2-phenylacetyl-CoA epoxidase subunit PaaC
MLFKYCLRLGDTNLILGHRLSEMCSRAPFLEEDIALANLALDHIGQAEALLQYAGQLEGKNRTEDDLAYLRPEWEFRNCLLAEQPNTDFAFVITRQFLIDVFQCLVYEGLQQSKDEVLAGMATRFLKEAVYHRRHSGSWVIRLGKGTEESHTRMQRALQALWKFTPELFAADSSEIALVANGLVPDMAEIFPKWHAVVKDTFSKAGLEMPETDLNIQSTHKPTVHTEHLGHLLAEMQYLQRAFPGASW